MAKIIVNNPRQIINGGAKKYYFKVKGLGGPKGDKGDKGDTGATGPQGPQGNAATVSVGSTTTLPVGQNATVENVGTLYNAVLNFGIPQGPRGPQGATGATGAKGDKGDQGNPGPQGEKGTNATVTVGTTTTTEPGTQAYAWNSSSNPNNAVINFNIPRGATGATGATGPQGPTGPAGADGADGQDGQNFTPTIVETLPTTGDESNLYLTPKNYTTGTATGNPITISLGEDAGQIDSFQLDGDTAQQTYTGKNLLNSLTFVKGRLDNGVVGYQDETSSLEATATDITFTTIANFRGITSDYIQVVGGSSYIQNQQLSLGNNMGGEIAQYDSSKTFIRQNSISTGAAITTQATTAYVRIYYFARNAGTITLHEPQLEAGSTATSFEPYVGGVPSPNPDYPQAIQTVTGEQTVTVTGKNLLNAVPYATPIQQGVKVTITNTNTIHIDGTSTQTYVNLTRIFSTNLPAGTYTMSINKELPFRVNLSTILSGGGSLDRSIQAGETSVTFTTSETTTGMRIFMSTGGAGIVFDETFTVQLVSGNAADYDFEPYSSTNYPLDLGTIELCKLGDYQDYIWKDGEDWKVHKATVSAIIDGSESWSTSGTNTFYVANIYSKIGNSIQSDSTGEMYASHFTIADITSSNTLVGASLRADAAHNVSNLRIRLQDMSGGVAGFRQMLSAKKPSIYARRLTPTDTTITDTNLIAQLEAVLQAKLQASNTITNTATGTNLAGDMELDYYEYDPTNRYDKWLWLRANNAYEEFNEEGGGGGGGSITVDSALSTTSKNPVQNKVVTAVINSKVDSSSLATVATSGSYNDLSNKPTIPTVNNGTLTIRQNGKTLGEFTANQSTNTTVNLTDNSSYSTSEVKTSATWINGKPIYKKTFSFTLANAESTTINHGISNFGLLIRFEGAVVQSDTKSVPIPRTLMDLNYQIGLEGVTTTSFEIDVGTSGPRGKQTYMTLWYTKTTD